MKQSEEVLTNDLLISSRCLKNRSSKIPEEIAEIREEDETFDFMRSPMFLPCLLRIKTAFAASSLVFLGSSFYFIVSTFPVFFFGRSLSTPRHLSQSDHVRAFPISLASVETNERSQVRAVIETFRRAASRLVLPATRTEVCQRGCYRISIARRPFTMNDEE